MKKKPRSQNNGSFVKLITITPIYYNVYVFCDSINPYMHLSEMINYHIPHSGHAYNIECLINKSKNYVPFA